ncbi:MAG: SRPBCC family protein [Gemmatimonadaceae bacterium]|jgi:uncharacterized protein YndB with AHSA1/START domain|nr:SRPBCC family protein [Gemmatimonadaceae bacterium]
MLKKLLIGLVVVVIALAGIGMLLPRSITVTRSTTINATPEQVFPLIASPREWPRWSAWNKRDPNMTITYSGPAAGAGAKWDWKSESQGDGSMVFTEANAPTSASFELTIVGMGPPSTGTFRLTPSGGSTTLEWTMTSDMGAGPVGRWFGLYFPSMLRKDFDEGLAGVKQLAESAPAPAAAPAATPVPAGDSAK